MDILFFITLIGGVILTLGYLPQIIKIYKERTTEGINIGFWYLIYAAVGITALNLSYDNAPMVLIIIQTANAALAGYIVLMVHTFRNQQLFGIILVTVMIILITMLPLGVSQSMATAFIMTAYLAQLITLVRADSVEGVSPWLYLIIAVGLGIMATKMFISEVSPFIIFTEITNILLLLLCAGATFLTQYKNRGFTIQIEEEDNGTI